MLLTQRNGIQNNLLGGFGSQSGDYEEKKKRLADERKREYKLFLEKKNEDEKNRKETRNRARQEIQQKQEMDYREMLRRKKEEEMRYRNVNDFEALDYASSSKPQAQTDKESDSKNSNDGFFPVSYLTPSPGQYERMERRRSRVYSAGPNLAPSNPSMATETTGLSPAASYSPSFTEKEVKKRPLALPETRPPFLGENTQNHRVNQPTVQVPTPSISKPENKPLGQNTQEYGWLAPKDDSLTRSTQGNSNNPNVAQQYRDELQKQIEDKKKRQEEVKRRERDEEEKLAKRIEEQRLKMQREYEEELAAKKKKEEETQKKHQALLEKQREMQQDADNQRKRARQYKSNDAETKWKPEPVTRLNSPPIPTLMKKAEVNRSDSPPIPTLRNREENGRKSPPIPTLKSKVESTTCTLKSDQTRQKLQKSCSLETPPPEIVDQITQFRQLLLLEEKKELEKEKILQQATYRVTSNHLVAIPQSFPLLPNQSQNTDTIHTVIASDNRVPDMTKLPSGTKKNFNLTEMASPEATKPEPLKRDTSCQCSSPKKPKATNKQLNDLVRNFAREDTPHFH